MNAAIFNSLCYTLGWFWLVLLGIRGDVTLAVFGAIILIILQLLNVKFQDLKIYKLDLILVFLVIPMGLLLEVIFIKCDVIRYKNQWGNVPPIWIVMLYPLFSLLFNHSLARMKDNYLIPFFLGFAAAPFSYYAGQSLGGLTLPKDIVTTWLILGIGWGLFLSIMTFITKRLETQ